MKMESKNWMETRDSPAWWRLAWLLIGWMAICSTGFGQSTGREIRVAVLALEGALQTEADLLIATLSSANVTVVERAELDRVLREQSLAARQQIDYVKVGRLLGADGLFLLQTGKSGADSVVDARLVSVRTSAVLGAMRYPTELKRATEWYKVVANRFSGLFPKLKVTRQEALPISVLNLRSAVNSATAAEVERELTTMLMHRLSSERDVFVLERRQLGSLQTEKEMSGEEEAAFWNGSYLIDGVIDKDGLSPDIVTLNVRLRPPGQGAPVNLEVSAPRQRPAEMVEQLVGKILGALERKNASPSWERAREAGQYLEEAQWAWRWKMAPETRMAADAAWFLGLHSLPVASLRVLSHQVDAGTLEFLVRKSQENSFVESSFYDPIRQTGWTTNEPAAQAMSGARAMLENYLELCRDGGSEWKTDSGWLALGFSALETTSELLRHCYNYATWKRDYSPDLAPLRELARQVDAALPPGAKREGYAMSPNVLSRFGSGRKPPANIFELRADYGTLWQDNPEMGVALYRTMIRSDAYAKGQRERLLLREWQNPVLAAWTPTDRERAPAAWQGFLRELSASSNRVWQAEGWLLKLAGARHDPQIEEAMENVARLAMDEARENYLTEFDFNFVQTLDALVKQKCKGPKTNRKPEMLASFEARRYALVKHFVRTVPVHELDLFLPICRDYPYTREQAREMLPMLAAYENRFTRPDWVETTRQMVAAKAGFSVEELRDLLKEAKAHDPKLFAERFDRFAVEGAREYTTEEAAVLLPVLQDYKARLGLKYEVQVVESHLTRLLAPVQVQPRVATNRTARTTGVLEASRAWDLNAPGSKLAGMTRKVAHVVRPSRGKALIGVTYGDPGMQQSDRMMGASFNALIELDLAVMDEKVLHKDIPGVGTGMGTGRLIYDADDSDVYMIYSPRVVRRLDRGTGRVRDYEVPFQMGEASSIQVLRGRVFVTSPEALVELNPGTGGLSILASARRRPAANQLDSRSGWGVAPQLFVRPDGALGAVFVDRLKADAFGWDQQKQDWLPTVSLPMNYMVHISHNGRQFVIRNLFHQYKAEIWDGVGAPAPLLQNQNGDAVPKWLFPMEVNISGSTTDETTPPLFTETNLYAFFTVMETTTTAFGVGMRRAQSWDLTMWHFDDRWEVPATIPIRFAREQPKDPRLRAYESYRWDVRDMPEGMIFLRRSPFDQGFTACWYVTHAEIRAREETLPKPEKRLPRRSAELLRQFDRNGDGRLDEAEAQTMRSDANIDDDAWLFHAGRVVETFDEDGDGKLSRVELETVLSNRGRAGLGLTWVGEPAATIMTRQDADGDGLLTPAELFGLFRPRANVFAGGFVPMPSVVNPATRPENITADTVIRLANLFGFQLTNTWRVIRSGIKKSGKQDDYFVVRQGDRETFATTLQQLNLHRGGPLQRVDAIPPNAGLTNAYSFFEPQAEGAGHWQQFTVTTNQVRHDWWVYLFDKGNESLFFMHLKSAPEQTAGGTK